jgi:hypothetical protein
VLLTAPKESDVLLDELGGSSHPLPRWRIAAGRCADMSGRA